MGPGPPRTIAWPASLAPCRRAWPPPVPPVRTRNSLRMQVSPMRYSAPIYRVEGSPSPTRPIRSRPHASRVTEGLPPFRSPEAAGPRDSALPPDASKSSTSPRRRFEATFPFDHSGLSIWEEKARGLDHHSRLHLVGFSPRNPKVRMICAFRRSPGEKIQVGMVRALCPSHSRHESHGRRQGRLDSGCNGTTRIDKLSRTEDLPCWS